MLGAHATYQLTDDDIHLWIINPQQISATPELHAILSEEENKKVDRYRSDKAKHTALITRSFIRLLLSKYEKSAPHQWKFSISDLGKPEVSNANLPLRFNLSHNDELIICAICLEKNIGCDIENLSRKVSVNAIADRFFSPDESLRIKASPAKFFEYWTLKEAFVKATGLGISQGLDTFSFQINRANVVDFNDNINLTFSENCKEKAPQNWYHTLLFPDNKHCIALSLNYNKKPDKKPTIRQFSLQDGASLFNH